MRLLTRFAFRKMLATVGVWTLKTRIQQRYCGSRSGPRGAYWMTGGTTFATTGLACAGAASSSTGLVAWGVYLLLISRWRIELRLLTVDWITPACDVEEGGSKCATAASGSTLCVP